MSVASYRGPMNGQKSPPHKGHQSGGGNYWIRTGVRDCSEIGALEPFGRMGNANWVILRF